MKSNSLYSIHQYLSKTNVQLGATYNVGKKSTAKYGLGYEAAAGYINASPREIGQSPLLPSNRLTISSLGLCDHPIIPQPLICPRIPRRLRDNRLQN